MLFRGSDLLNFGGRDLAQGGGPGSRCPLTPAGNAGRVRKVMSDLVTLETKPDNSLHEITKRPFRPRANRGRFVMGSICTTEVCDLSCVFCHFNGPKAPKKSKQLEPHLVTKALQELPKGSQVYFAATGDLFMDEHAVEHLEAAVQRGLDPLVLSHGQRFTPEVLDTLLNIGVRRFRMSCDAIEPKAYAKIRRGGELQRILDAAEFLRNRKPSFPDITVEINCTLLSNTFPRQDEMIEFWRERVDAVNFNAEYFDTFRFRNTFFTPQRRVDCHLQTYVLPSGKITPCCAVMVHAHDHDVSWLPDIRTHSLQEAHDQLCDMYEDPSSELSALCRQCDWWIMWAKKGGMTPYLRSVRFNDSFRVWEDYTQAGQPSVGRRIMNGGRALFRKLSANIRRVVRGGI